MSINRVILGKSSCDINMLRILVVERLSFDLDIESEATFELKEHVDGVASLHVIVRDVLLVSQRLSSVDQTNHWHVNSLFLL